MFAEVVLSMGRYHLRVGGFYLATEGDKCRNGNLPEEVLPPIPPEELEKARVGGKPVNDMPINIVRWFRGDNWDERMMRYVAEQINKQVPCPTPDNPAPPETIGTTS
jgi:hypothetical protein